jgi:D-sedoheptulose 7-phosphate isomerase
MIDDFFSELQRVIKEIDNQKIQAATDILFDAWENDKTVFIMGCGGSASTATHFAADLSKTILVPGAKGLKAMALVDNIPLVSAWINDYGWNTIFKEQLESWLKKDDVLVGFSVHGGSGEEANFWSQNLVQAMKLAKERGAKIIGFSGFDGGAMAKMSDASIVVPVNSEPLGTPLTESFHVVLHHLIIISLKNKIKEYLRSYEV